MSAFHHRFSCSVQEVQRSMLMKEAEPSLDLDAIVRGRRLVSSKK